MVFESLVTDVLNNVLGDYVENLDSKQLKIGIWGGDVVLKNLVLKQSALNNLDLPVQAVYGRLSKLVLKIPWKNLYYSSVEASIEGLYLIVEPSQQIQYDAEKEEKRDFDAKQAMLAQIEEARKKKLESKKKVDDSLVEKLTTQIIRNVQVSIKNIHVRYEDRITNPGHPFTMGVTLSKLIVQTTDSEWVPSVVYDDKAHVKIHKIIDLEGLAVYWNCNSLLYCTLPFDDIVERLHSEIPTSTTIPEEYNYILGPISSSARVKINPKPEYDNPAFSVPKAIANLEIEKLSLALTNLQYRDIIAFADSMDLMTKAVVYRKYRPNVPSYKGYYKEWWRFAYKCILEEEILRIRRNWSWSHIKEHRQLLRDYGHAYKIKLQDKKCPPEILSKLAEMEKELDVMNIVMVRQRIQLEMERLGKTQEQQQPSRGWFSSWWSKSEDAEKPTEQSSSLVSQFQAAMTAEEKQRLYNAIDYQENAAAVEFPPYFVENSCIFVLKSLEITLTDEDGQVLYANLEDVKLKVETRPVTNGLSVFVNIHKLMVLGIPQDDLIPELISSQTTEDNVSLLDVTFETNPVDSIYGQRLYLIAKPLRVIYDAITINRALDVFKVPQSSALAQLSEATATTISDVKTRSTAGIQYLVDQHVLVDIKIDLYAPYLVLPYGGVYRGAENIIVANLGYLKVTSTDRPKSTIKEKHLKADDADDIFKVLMEESYDKFIIELTQLQILLVPGGEEWMDIMKENKTSPLHLLKPISLFLTFHKCLIDNDARLAQSKLSGVLPSIKMVVSDHQIILLSALMNSIPFPKDEESPALKEMDAISVHSEATYTFMDKAASNIKMLELVAPDHRSPSSDEASKQKLHAVQFTLMQINFIMEELSVIVNHQEFTNSPYESVAEFNVSNLVLDVCTKTFVNSVTIKLGSLHLLKYHNNTEVEIIGTPICARPGTFLFEVDFVQVDKKCPDFKTTYSCCEQMLSFEFALIKIVLHQEVLLELVKFTSDLQVQLEELQNTVDTYRAAEFKRRLSSISDTLVARSSMTAKPQTKSTVSVSKNSVIETILFKLDAKLTELDLLFANDACDISQLFVKDLNLEVIMKKPYTQVKAVLREIEILDCTPGSIYPKILAIGDEEAINMQIVMYNREPDQVSFIGEDISIMATFGGLHFTFLNVYITTMSSFIDNFQAARAAIIEASQAAADKAKNNVTNIYENATRISLNVRMRAPKIVIPRNSKDYNALYIDLGNLHISNSFIILDIKNERDEPAVVDEIQLKLTDFKLSRIMTNIKRTITNDVTILLPLSFSLNMKRNLSSKWYKAIPEVHIVGQIESIEIHIGQPDYNMMLATLNGNLAEGAKDEVQKPSSIIKVEVDQGVLTTSSATTMKPCDNLILLDKTDGAVDIVDKNTSIFLKFNFMMNGFVVSLFTIDEKIEDKFSFTTKRQGLARLSLEGFSVKGRILSDNTINTSVLLVDILLDDIRPGKEHRINRLFSRKVFGYTECLARTVTAFAFKTMVDITYKQKNDDTYLDVRISSFDLILSMDFLTRVQKFFTSALEEAEGDVDVKVETKAKQTKGSQTSRMSTTVSAPSQTPGSFSFNIQIEQPDIVFVETMRSIDTNCLILNCEILIKLRIDGVRQSVSGTMKDIQMYTCYYNPEKRTNTKGNVLYPFSISIAGATPEGEGLHLEVCLTKMHLRVSPNIIELLNRVYVTMYRSSETAMVQDDTIQDHSQLWDFKPYKESDHWYLRTEVADEVDEDLGVVDTKVKKLNEICFVRLPALIITVEAGIGNKTLPMLLMESHFDGKIKNWSSNMVMDATLTFQMGYYNSVLAVWEPLIEPVEDHKDGNEGYKPWELRMFVTINNIEEDTPVISPIAEGEFQEMITPQPRMVIEFTSSTNLEMTVTRTALEVLSALGNAFAEAVSTDTKHDVELGAPYKVKNETGLNVKILLANSSFQVFNNPTPKEILLASGTEVPLELKPELERGELELNTEMKPIQKYLHLLFVQMNCEVVLNLIRADSRYFSLKYRGEFNNYWGIISHTVVEDGVIEATLSGIVKVYNHLDLPVDIYFMTSRGNELKSIGTIEPGSVFNVPMKAIYTPTNELFFSVPQYCVTNTPFIWKDLQSNVNQTQILLCHPKDEAELGHSEPFVIKTVGKVEQVFNENTLRYTMASILCKVHLRPAVTFTNSLPVPISVTIQDITEENRLDPGSTLTMHHVNPGNSYIIVRLLNYFEREWSCIKDIPVNPVEFSVWTFDSFQGSRKLSIDLGLHCLHDNGTLVLSLYCPFWMLNKSELNLSYRKSKKTEKNEASGSPLKNSDENLNILLHPANRKDLILFSFNPKNFFGKKKASVRISNGGEWSDKFSIDVAGSSGVVTCKYEGKIYQLGVHIQLTYNNLTKQVTFTPYYVMINSAHFAIECQEFNRPADAWTPVQPNSCAALWPVGDHDDKLLKLRVVGTEEVSAPFFITESHTTLLKLKNKYGGVYVDIQITEGAVYINFFKYDDGMAPVLVVNHTRDTLNIWEKETVQLRKLEPGYKFFYTWENPSGDRVLVWEGGYKKEIEDDLRKDGCGEYAVGDNNYVYWVSFLDGMQRVLLFTCDRTVAENAQQAKRFAIIDQEVILSIHGIGLSLVNNIERREIMYMRIASSGIIWETCKNQGHRYKQLSQKDSNNIEEAYQLYQQRKFFSDEGIGRCVIDAKTEVDFELNEMYKPHHRKLRRTFLTGLWVQMSTNATLMQLHAKINRLQIDNQIFDCVFPVVLAPVPLPKTVANTDVHRPFAELSIVQLLMKHSQIKQYKYFKVLIQEFHVKLDLAFVASVTNVFPQATQSDLEAEKQKFLLDVDLVNNPLYQHVSLQSQQEQKSFYDVLHFSPLKIHVSFSLASNDTSGQNVNTPNALNVLLQGLGVTLTDMQDVVFKLGYFEREYTFLTQKQLVNEASSHYIGQAIKQLYVLVLGLDVLGNPYGLVLGITKGVEDLFYEPFQGAIQGPGEFAEGLALGVRSLFGHTVGGAAGAVSRITGAMGKGLAALTFDKEYQRKRQNQLNKAPGSVPEGIARSGKGLVMGVYDGITGVVRKPISGAKEEGVGGFIKGLGKGAVGLVTRPTAGVIDFASSSLDTVKRVTELTGEEAQRVRFARYIPADGLITPYNYQHAAGYKLLNEMDKGKYANTDVYVYHYNVIFKKEVLLITDKRIAYITHNDLFGGWQVNWTYTLQEIVMPPKIVPKGVAITLIDAKKKKTNLFSSSESGKTVLISDRKVCEDICLRISELQKSI